MVSIAIWRSLSLSYNSKALHNLQGHNKKACVFIVENSPYALRKTENLITPLPLSQGTDSESV
jgi:hypothetical protein